jgi:DNA-binding transcriptional MerR regulator
MYRVKEFAALAGVTVRALHHYDRLGLLKPTTRTTSGYREYCDADFARLEQIVVLKFLGLPLRDIAGLLNRQLPLKDTLRRQRHVLAEKRRGLDAAIHAIERAERASGEHPEWDLFRRIVREIEMQNDTDWTKKYYTDEAHLKVEERKPLWSPELQARIGQQWSELIADVEAAIERAEDPSGAAAQALVSRWRDLLAGFTAGDPDIQRGLTAMWQDRANWPDGEAKRFHMPAEVPEFIARAMAAGRPANSGTAGA